LLAAAKAAFTATEAGGTVKWSEREDDANDQIERRRGCVFAPLAGTPALPDLTVFGRLDGERTKLAGKTETKTQYLVMSERPPAWRMMSMIRYQWRVENHLHRQLDVVFRNDDARARKNHASTNLSVIRRMALDMLQAHPLRRSPARKMNLARWKRSFFFELFTYVR
jgi:hypothetical protein